MPMPLFVSFANIAKHAQSVLNNTQHQIKEKFPINCISLIDQNETEKEKPSIKIKFYTATLICYFNDKDICTTSSIIPENIKDIDNCIQHFNQHFVPDDAGNQWSDEQSCIKLNKDGKNIYFTFTLTT